VIDIWESLLRTLSALAIVLVLMGLLAIAARRVMGNRLGLVGTRPLVHVLASGYVAPRKTIALVSVAGEYLIIGATATDLVPLGRVSDAAKVQELLASTAVDPSSTPASAPRSLFASLIQQLPTGSFSKDKGSHGEQ
jgi:flagellar protein FliO/FliZ